MYNPQNHAITAFKCRSVKLVSHVKVECTECGAIEENMGICWCIIPPFLHFISQCNLRLKRNSIPAFIYFSSRKMQLTFVFLANFFQPLKTQIKFSCNNKALTLTSSHQPTFRSRQNFSFQPRRTLAPSCLLYTSPSPRDKRQSRMPSSA